MKILPPVYVLDSSHCPLDHRPSEDVQYTVKHDYSIFICCVEHDELYVNIGSTNIRLLREIRTLVLINRYETLRTKNRG